MNPLPLGHCDPSFVRLYVEPIDPQDLIAGDPIIRYATLRKTSDGGTVGMRDYSAGRFRRRYSVEEVLQIVEGCATVVDEKHRVWSLREGDVVTFRQGTAATWQVPEYMRALSLTCRTEARLGAYRHRALQAATAIGATAVGLALASTGTTVTLIASALAS